jgi:cyclase
MTLIPAIDLMDGQCVRLVQGDYNKRKTYAPSPLEMARLFERMGYEWLHVIDLDGAEQASLVNAQVLEKIGKESSLKIQVGGGIRTLEDVARLLKLGVDRVIIGSMAVREPEFIRRAIERFGAEAIVVSLDMKGDEIRISGWKEVAPLSASEFLKKMKAMGLKQVLCTDILRDGMTGGVRPEFYEGLVADFPNFEWIAAGGIRNAQDKVALEAVGVSHVVMGSRFYEGSLLMKRIIPCLDIKDGRVVKGVQFEGLRDAGDPLELARRYSEEGADELTFLDITATSDKRKTVASLAEAVAKVIQIPFTIGGGIRSVEDVRAVLAAGADKVSVGSAGVARPDLIDEISLAFGSQCLVISIDAKRVDDEAGAGGKNGGEKSKWKVSVKGGRELTEMDVLDWAQEVEKRGAGEILLNSIESDGAKSGFDLELLRAVSAVTTIPVIASGGAGKVSDFIDLFEAEVCDAALAASVFHYGEIGIGELKKELKEKGVAVRV